MVLVRQKLSIHDKCIRRISFSLPTGYYQESCASLCLQTTAWRLYDSRLYSNTLCETVAVFTLSWRRICRPVSLKLKQLMSTGRAFWATYISKIDSDSWLRILVSYVIDNITYAAQQKDTHLSYILRVGFRVHFWTKIAIHFVLAGDNITQHHKVTSYATL